ncbi:MAG: hypothetical protein HC896_03260 [Bacteroidales bacterium]|nr:hypothetical protein [Bacteroidales bacterium]
MKEIQLTEEQKRLYKLQQSSPEMSGYNVPACFKTGNHANVDTLNEAWAYVLQQYTILKARIIERDSNYFYYIDEKCKTVVHKQEMPSCENDEQRVLFLQEQLKQPFNLMMAP